MPFHHNKCNSRSDSEGNYNDEYAQRCKRFDISFVCIEYSTSYNFSDIDFVGTMHRVASIEDFARKEEIDFFHFILSEESCFFFITFNNAIGRIHLDFIPNCSLHLFEYKIESHK